MESTKEILQRFFKAGQADNGIRGGGILGTPFGIVSIDEAEKSVTFQEMEGEKEG